VWRTGPYTVSSSVSEGLGLNSNEQILGFLYIGTPMKADRPMKAIKKDDFFKCWPAKV
jgi:hypothetical protein